MSELSNKIDSDIISVMLVDDSAVVRGLIGRVLENEPDIKIVASVSNGEQGVSSAARHNPDIIILDIEMPIMDGITALPKILAASPGVRVLMCSTLTARNAEVTLKALALGATDYITKPTNSTGIHAAGDFKTEIVRMVRALGPRPDRKTQSIKKTSAVLASNTYAGGANAPLKQKTPFTLKEHKPGENFYPQLIAIGSSTGGPQALFKTIAHFKDFNVPIIVTQHMPATFTKILAQHIGQHAGIESTEGENGMIVENGKVYVAPGGQHMTFIRKDGRVEILLDDGPLENYCKPSVDPMLRSALKVWGSKILTVILTGMGHDGLEGCKLIAASGGRVIAQDQESSVVWGMPGAVATQGICTAVLPLADIGLYVRRSMGRL